MFRNGKKNTVGQEGARNTRDDCGRSHGTLCTDQISIHEGVDIPTRKDKKKGGGRLVHNNGRRTTGNKEKKLEIAK